MPVRRRRFSSSPRSPGDLRGRLLQGDLDLGQGRDRDFRRHGAVEDAVAAEIAVGQHVIADGLRLPQAAAMADHEPAMRAQHRQMIGDVLGVRRADADIDERDPVPVPAHEVIGRHLEAVPGRGADQLRDGLVQAALDGDAAGRTSLV